MAFSISLSLITKIRRGSQPRIKRKKGKVQGIILASVVLNKNVPCVEVDHWKSDAIQEFHNL